MINKGFSINIKYDTKLINIKKFNTNYKRKEYIMAKINIENITYETMIALATHEYLNNGDGLNPYDMYSHPPAEQMAY